MLLARMKMKWPWISRSFSLFYSCFIFFLGHFFLDFLSFFQPFLCAALMSVVTMSSSSSLLTLSCSLSVCRSTDWSILLNQLSSAQTPPPPQRVQKSFFLCPWIIAKKKAWEIHPATRKKECGRGRKEGRKKKKEELLLWWLTWGEGGGRRWRKQGSGRFYLCLFFGCRSKWWTPPPLVWWVILLCILT